MVSVKFGEVHISLSVKKKKTTKNGIVINKIV